MSDQTTEAGGPSSATAVKEQASEAASTAVAKTGEVAGTATEGAKQVASEATRQAGQLTQEALESARGLVTEATGSLREQAGQQTERVASGVRSLSDQVRALAEGRPGEAGPAADYVRQAGEKLQEVADRLESGGIEGALSDLQGFARRRPGVFLLGAAAAGFAVGRLVRGAQAAKAEGGNGSSKGSAAGNGAELPLGRTDGPLATTSSLGAAPGEALEIRQRALQASRLEAIGHLLELLAGLACVVARGPGVVGPALGQRPHLVRQGAQPGGGPVGLLARLFPQRAGRLRDEAPGRVQRLLRQLSRLAARLRRHLAGALRCGARHLARLGHRGGCRLRGLLLHRRGALGPAALGGLVAHRLRPPQGVPGGWCSARAPGNTRSRAA